MPIFSARNRRKSAADFRPISSPSMRTDPAVGSIRPLIKRTSVDFPDPDSPMMQKISPRSTVKLAPATPMTQS